MTLTEALKVPGTWWVVLKKHQYSSDGLPTKIEVLEIFEEGHLSHVRINDAELTRLGYTFDQWEAYANFWLAWAAVQRSSIT